MAAARQSNPTDKREFNLNSFEGLNTRALRQAIKPTEQAWLENIMPIGDANAKVVPNISAQLASIQSLVGSPRTPYYAEGFNIIISGTATDVMMIADTTGDLWQFNCNTNTLKAVSWNTARAGFYKQSNCAQWKNERILIIDNTHGYSDWNGTTLTSTGYTGAPTSGQCIQVFSGQVWISNNRTVSYSTINGYQDFSTSNGGAGSFIVTDPNLHSSIQTLVVANNYLYIFGIDSINVISDPTLTGPSGSQILTFTNTNLSTGVGTPFPMTVIPFYRTLWFGATSGFYGLYGSNSKKASINLDGVFQLINNVGTPGVVGGVPVISAGLVEIYNILCIAFLFQYQDPVLGARQLIALSFNDRWFLASQGANSGNKALNLIAGNSVAGTNTLYGTDIQGNIYRLFADTTTAINFKWQTPLFDMEHPEEDKQWMRLGVGAQYAAATSSALTVYANTENSTTLYNFASASTLVFSGTGNIQFQGAGAQNIYWTTVGYALAMANVSGFGKYIGATISGSGVGVVFTLSLMEYIYRALW